MTARRAAVPRQYVLTSMATLVLTVGLRTVGRRLYERIGGAIVVPDSPREPEVFAQLPAEKTCKARNI